MSDDATRTAVEARLAAHADRYTVGDQLHDVPPHAVYEVTVDGRRAVCKLATHPRGDPATEGRVQEHVATETTVPTPAVLAVGEDYYLAAWDPEVPAEGVDLDEARARTMGAGLARLHRQTGFDATGIPRAGDDGLAVDRHDTWAATVEASLAEMRDYVADQGYGHVVDDVLAFVGEHPDAFDGHGDPVLCHGNWLPDHVGVDAEGTTPATRRSEPVAGAVTCVVDFEHALVAPPAYDYWRTAMPLASNHPDEVVGAFRGGYEAVRSLPSALAERKPVYGLVNLVQYLSAVYLQENVPPAEADRQADRMAQRAEEILAELRERDWDAAPE